MIGASAKVESRVRHRLSRVGIIDVGSNSVRLVVFDGAARSPAYFYNEKILCGLGRRLADTGRLDPEGRRRALKALERFAVLARTMDMQSLQTVATAAVREASDGPSFCVEVRDRTGLDLEVASGTQEARLAAQGVLLGWPDAEGLVCDMGGASMELAEVAAGAVGRVESMPLGPLTLGVADGKAENHGESGPSLTPVIEGLRERFGGVYKRLFLVGGSFRAIARLDMELTGYPLHVLHEYRMSPGGLMDTLARIRTASVSDLHAIAPMSVGRGELVPNAAVVLATMIEVFRPDEIAISGYGIREGLLYQNMPEKLRRRDPLIEVCRAMEASSARFPGFGDKLAKWVRPLFRGRLSEQKRLIRAACLLHDVTWRAHPDYRADVCFDNATRANLGGLDHAGRVFIGMALRHRYSKSTGAGPSSALATLLPATLCQDAEVLGRAMRLGALLGGASTAGMGTLRTDSSRVRLAIDPDYQALFGETVERRLEALARAMGKRAEVVM